MPDYVRGVINLRGKIVPVIDLRHETRPAEPGHDESHLHCRHAHYDCGGATKLMGLIVDALEEVYQINAEDIEPAPDFGKGASNDHIQNMAKARGHVKALLNIDRIVEDDHALLPADAAAVPTAGK